MSGSIDRFADTPPGCGWRAIVLGIACVAVVGAMAYTVLNEMSVLDFIRLAWRIAWRRPTVETEVVMALTAAGAIALVWLEARKFRRAIGFAQKSPLAHLFGGLHIYSRRGVFHER